MCKCELYIILAFNFNSNVRYSLAKCGLNFPRYALASYCNFEINLVKAPYIYIGLSSFNVCTDDFISAYQHLYILGSKNILNVMSLFRR